MAWDAETQTPLPELPHPELTDKEYGVLKEMRKGKTLNKAIAKVYGGSPKAVSVTSNRLRKRKRFLRYLEKQGLTTDLVVKRIVEELSAEKVEFDKAGNEHRSPHHMARIAAIDRAMKLRGLTLDEQERESENTTPMVVRSIKFELGEHKVSFNPVDNGNTTESEIIEGDTIPETE